MFATINLIQHLADETPTAELIHKFTVGDKPVLTSYSGQLCGGQWNVFFEQFRAEGRRGAHLCWF